MQVARQCLKGLSLTLWLEEEPADTESMSLKSSFFSQSTEQSSLFSKNIAGVEDFLPSTEVCPLFSLKVSVRKPEFGK